MAAKHLVDTNVLVRFLTGQPPDMAAAAKRLIERADAGEMTLEIMPLILAESIYTLESFYQMDRRDVASKLLVLLQSRGIHPREREWVIDALERHRDNNIHFADAVLGRSRRWQWTFGSVIRP